jgi:hypothetical protein
MSTTKNPPVLAEILDDWTPRPKIAPEGLARVLPTIGTGLGLLAVAGRAKKSPTLIPSLSESGEFTGVEAVKPGRDATGWLRLAGWSAVGAGLLTAYAYREPQFEPAGSAPDFSFAPVDGKFLAADRIEDEPVFLKSAAYKILIISHMLDLPVVRAPFAGRLQFVYNRPGQPLQIGLEGTDGRRVLMTFETSPYRRDISLPVPFSDRDLVFMRKQAGDPVQAHEKIGVRGFGRSVMTTVYLQTDVSGLLARLGKQCRAGLTVLSRL